MAAASFIHTGFRIDFTQTTQSIRIHTKYQVVQPLESLFTDPVFHGDDNHHFFRRQKNTEADRTIHNQTEINKSSSQSARFGGPQHYRSRQIGGPVSDEPDIQNPSSLNLTVADYRF